MPSFAEALYNLPTERLRQLVLTRRLDAKKLALIPNKKQLAQFVSVELGKPASVTEAILQCSARELRLLQLLLGVEGEQVMAWDALLRAAGGGPELSARLITLMSRLEELGLAFRVQNRQAQSKPPSDRKTAASGAKAAKSAGETASDSSSEQNAHGAAGGEETAVPTGVWMPNSARQFVPASLSDRYTLERCLELYDAVSLKRICDTLGLPQDTKPVNVAAVKKLLMGDGVKLHLPRPLTEDEINVLEYVVQQGGSATAIEVATAALDNQTEDFFRYDWQNRWKQGKARNAVDTLLARGLLYVVSYGYGYNLFLLIPGDLLRVLSGSGDMGFWTMPAPAPAPLAESPPRTTTHAGLLRDVVALLGFMSAQDASRTSTGSIHKTSLKNMMRGLSLPEDRYASFLYAVCREAKLIDTVGEKQVYKITATGNSWLHWDGVAQTRALVEAWRKGALWGEMYNEPLHKNSDYRSAEAVQRMRGAALSIVAEAERQGTGNREQGTENTGGTPDASTSHEPRATNHEPRATSHAFYDLTSVTETLTFRYPLLLSNSTAYGNELVPSPATFIRLLVGECLYWLGLAELAEPAPLPSAVNNLAPALVGAKGAGAESALTRGATAHKPTLPEAIGYRLTPMGAFLLGVEGVTPPLPAPREDHFIVQANGEIFVSPYLEPATLYHLLAMTETPAKGATGNTVSLTRESIRRCLDQGEQTRDVVAFLQAHARTGIPQNVEYLINDVGGKHGHIRLGKAQMYVQVETPLLLKELQARKEIKPYFVRTLSDTVALLNSDDPDKLMRELRKAGYLPVSDDDKPQSTLALKAKPAPPPAPIAVSADPKAAKRAARADASLGSVDWARIAQDDDKPYNNGKQDTSAVTLANVTRNQTLIKTLLVQASKMRRVVEIEYLEQGTPIPVQREIQPISIVGTYLNAVDRETDNITTFVLGRIQWARLTEEIF